VLLAVPFHPGREPDEPSASTQAHGGALAGHVGHFKGGLGHINVVVSMNLAGISGSSTAEAAGIGSLLIPAMKKQGYDSSFSVALIVLRGDGSDHTPSILMVVWGGIMSVSIGALFPLGLLCRGDDRLSQMVCVVHLCDQTGYPVYERAP